MNGYPALGAPGLPRTLCLYWREAHALFPRCTVRDDNNLFTAYRGANLLRMDAVARTNEPWVAYKYEAGLKGFSTDLTPRVTWHDTGGHPQRYEFGGVTNETIVPLKAASRVLVAEGKGASLATFPPRALQYF